MINRRTLLGGVALTGLVAVAGCTTSQVTAFEAQWATIAGQIQYVVSNSVAAYIPTIESIAETAASLFGPQYIAIVQVGTAAFNAIVATLENIVNNLTPPASAHLRMKLKGSSPSVPVVIGTTSGGVRVMGWKS